MRHLIFIVNGEDVPIERPENTRIGTAKRHALKQSYNTGRDPDQWTVRNEAGVELREGLTIGSLRQSERLFLTLAVGLGGSR